MTSERPVAGPPEILRPLVESGLMVRWHKQNIIENLSEIFDARYFVKLGGRRIRGNAIAEAISCGTVVLADPRLLIQRELLPDSAFIEDLDSLRARIQELDQNPGAYAEALAEQQKRLRFFGIECPLAALHTAVDRKRRLAGHAWGRMGLSLGRRIAPIRYYLDKHLGHKCASTI